MQTFAPSHSTHSRTSVPLPVVSVSQQIVIVGAGAFGGWTALMLQRLGYAVTLIDAWGAGNSRSSSGDETRVIRSTYGGNETYFDLNVRARTLWKEFEQQQNQTIFHNSGVLWFCYQDHTPLVDDSIPFAKKHQMEYEYLSVDDLRNRFPLVQTNDLHHAYFDPYGGYLKARESCQLVLKQFQHNGGKFVQASVMNAANSKTIHELTLSTGEKIKGDLFIFACGSWLGQLFPDVLGNVITCTRQEVFYFGSPTRHAQSFDTMPVWVDVDGHEFYYGIAGNAQRGFKIGVDKRGAPFDPTNGDHTLNEQVLKQARNFISHRFPALGGAPLLESRVCPYENSPDGNFLIELHPHTENVLFVGGGSGHGFKHAPALGELVAQTLHGTAHIPALFRRTLH